MTMYIPWDREQGLPSGVPSNLPLGDGREWLECSLPKSPRTSSTQCIKWILLSGTHGDYVHGSWAGSEDPLDNCATKDDINLIHRKLETSPIMVFGQLFDCDEKSEIRMRDAIAYWDLRPIEPGVFEEREIDGVVTKIIIWTRGDNSLIELTREQLQAVFNEMLAQRAIRGAILFASLRRFKDSSETTLKEIEDPENWGIYSH